MTGRQLRAELLVEGGFSESSSEQTPFRVAVRRLYNLALLSRQVEDLQAIATNGCSFAVRTPARPTGGAPRGQRSRSRSRLAAPGGSSSPPHTDRHPDV